MTLRRGALGLALLAACSVSPPAPTDGAPLAQVSLGSLLAEMLDRNALARWPEPAYECRQASSYDRASVARGAPGWYANDDRNHYLRDEAVHGHVEHVLVDEEGPGALVRFWATWGGAGDQPFPNGALRIYLDGAARPEIEAPIADVVGGDALVGAPLSQAVPPGAAPEVRGHDLYLPIPFARGCRVTYETPRDPATGEPRGEILYWSVTWRRYAQGTRVESFSRAGLADAAEEVRAAQAALADGVDHGAGGGERAAIDGRLEPGATLELALQGPAAVRGLQLRLSADDPAQALRSTVLELDFDGEVTGWCPLEAFFGTGYLGSPLSTWTTRGTADGTLQAAWVMPFERTARVRLRNLGEQPVGLQGELRSGPWHWDERSLLFHATWRELWHVPTQTGPDAGDLGAFDAPFVAVRGRGVYAGDTLSVFNASSAWWGEGDEKVCVDGADFPAHIGTGTEDYYGYAWCRPEPFSAPFHAQPLGAGNLQPGLSMVGRWRALDAIPFRSALRFDMELWHWARTRVNWAPATFWYARPGARCDVAPDPEAARRPVARTREDVIEVQRVPGALEGETLAVLERGGGVTEVQDIPEFGWSAGRQLWWRDARPGDRLVLALPAAQAGRQHLRARLTVAPDYGQVRMLLGDRELIRFDGYAPAVGVQPVDLGEVELAAGENRLVIEVTGRHPAAEARHMFGLDCLVLEPAAD